jgi:hypothetical protein
MTKKLIVISLLASILLAGCTLNTAIPATQVVPTLVAEVLPPEVAVEIQNQISQTLGAPVEQVQIDTVEQREWPDSCLGLGTAEESCAQALTPGWLVELSVDGSSYVFRANETGTMIRQEP